MKEGEKECKIHSARSPRGLINNLNFYTLVCETAEEFRVRSDEFHLRATTVSIIAGHPVHIRAVCFAYIFRRGTLLTGLELIRRN